MTDRELDAWAAEHVMGWQPMPLLDGVVLWQKKDVDIIGDEWQPSTSPSDDYAVLKEIVTNRSRALSYIDREIVVIWARRWNHRNAAGNDVGTICGGTLYLPGDWTRAAYEVLGKKGGETGKVYY